MVLIQVVIPLFIKCGMALVIIAVKSQLHCQSSLLRNHMIKLLPIVGDAQIMLQIVQGIPIVAYFHDNPPGKLVYPVDFPIDDEFHM